MFKKGQVVAIKLHFGDTSQYQRIVRIVPGIPGVTTRVYLSEDDANDPRLFYSDAEIRPLTKEEIEGA